MSKPIVRCEWAVGRGELYQRYHDDEWGTPVFEDQKLFEFLVLESAQAGLSWQTILNKREGYRKVFKDFDPKKVAELNETEVEKILLNPNIVRNRLKVNSAISNAKVFLLIQKEFGSFSNYLWNWVNNKPIQNNRRIQSDVPAVTPIAEALAKDLKKRGFKFLGPTIMYAFMQAVGMVNDHTTDCYRNRELKSVSIKCNFDQ